MNGQGRRVALAAAWLAVAVLVSLGAAGIVGTMAHLPGTPSRAELTYEGDKAIEPGLKAAETSLLELAGEVRQLSELGRGALAALVNRDVDTLNSLVAEGKDLTLAIDAHTTELRGQIESLPGIGPQSALVLSADSRGRQARALAALDATAGLSAAWSRLAIGAIPATRITELLTEHDRVTIEAAALGKTGKYTDALDRLNQSDRMITEARSLRDELAATVDVTTLTQWLDLNADYDAALRRLYLAVVASNGAVTAEVRAAFDAEAAARKRLPSDTRGLVVILAEVGRGGLNQAVIGIEEARGKLDAATGLLGGAEDGSSGASGAP